MNRRIVILAVVILAILIGVIIYLTSYQKLTITFSENTSGVSASVYKASANDDASPESSISDKNLVKQVDKTSSLKLRRGSYVVATTGNADYQQQSQKINLGSKSVSVVVNPQYSEAKLKNLLAQDKSAIDTAVGASVTGISGKYVVSTGKLYGRGDWYGTVISPNVSEQVRRTSYLDTFRLVAHKENGNWKVVTLPPQLILSKVVYPTIPRDVLVDVNQQKP